MATPKETVESQVERVNLKVEMLRDARIIMASVDFLEKEIEKVSLQIDLATEEYRYEAVEGLKKNMLHLLRKLNEETKSMTVYMRKYKTLLDDEKKTLLFSLSKTQPLPIRRVPANQSGTLTGQKIQTEVEA